MLPMISAKPTDRPVQRTNRRGKRRVRFIGSTPLVKLAVTPGETAVIRLAELSELSLRAARGSQPVTSRSRLIAVLISLAIHQ